MTFYEIGLHDDELAALRVLMADMPKGVMEAQALRALVKDHLIGLGVLALPAKDRSRGARASAG